MSSTDATIRELVDGLFERERSADCYEHLKSTAIQAAPFLLAAFGEGRPNKVSNRTGLSPQDAFNLNAPVYRAGDLLAASGLPEAVSHFLERTASPDVLFRDYGAWGLGNTASAGCSEPVKRIFAAEERKTRIFAAIGIGRALKLRRGEPAFFDAMAGSLGDFLLWENGDVYGTLVEEENRHGTAMSSEERNFLCASLYYFEIQNGGPWQYFGNATAQDHQSILTGLSAIGAHETARTLEAAGAVFGPTGPPKDRDARNAMIDAFDDGQVMRVNDLYGTFPSGGENIEMSLFLYVVQNGTNFRIAKPNCGCT